MVGEAWIAMALAACTSSGETFDIPEAPPPRIKIVLTASDLRPALLRTIAAHPRFFQAALREATEKAELIHRPELEGLIDIGSFRCDLARRVFVYSPGAYFGPGYASGSTRGEFILNDKSEWVGKLTGSTRK